MEHLRPFHRLPSIRTSDDKDLQAGAHEEMEGGAQVMPNLPIDPDAHLSYDERVIIDRKLVRKLDMTLIPWLCLLYLMAFLDRTNIGNAKIAGLQQSIHHGAKDMSLGQYNAALSIFFVSYSIFEPLTNVMLKRFSPRRFIPVIMILWGIIMTSMGFVKTWSGLMTARWFLGIAEAGLFPGVNYYLSCWYCRDEFGIRAAVFFSAAAVSGSFGGLLAAAIGDMNGIGGYKGWSWIFILEGLLTIVCGVLSFWLVQNFPDNADFLSEQDRARVIYRLAVDKQSSAGHEDFDTSFVKQAFKDYKMWLGMWTYMGADMSLYAFALFLPQIVKDMGYTSTKAQLLTVPPYAFAALLTIGVGYFADRTGQRGLCNIVIAPLGIAGFAILLSVENPHVKYFACYLAALGIYPCISNTISWVSNNIEGVYKRGVVLGFVIGWGNLNGIVSSNIFQLEPFKAGYATVLGYMTLCLFAGSIALRLLLSRENKLRRKGGRDYWLRGKTREQVEKMGDRRPDFLYTL
ncbi:MFS nicotinic acid transporter-like protein [Stipitochalara longipes BDJ]|nr:MFS nicotinic acid transporter-like protein [Stipitochalara longipes BDJ]